MRKNPKIETRNPKQNARKQIQSVKTFDAVTECTKIRLAANTKDTAPLDIRILNLFRISYFDIRVFQNVKI